jgi:hypothetical protein
VKILEFLRDFEIHLSGGFAWFALMCMLFVIVVAFTQLLGWIIKYLP